MSVTPAKNKILIGITGSIASGKSTVSNYLKSKGYFIIDSDAIVNDLYQTNKDLSNFLIKNFHTTDKKEISKLIFNNQRFRTLLESFIHPLVLDEIDKSIQEKEDTIIFIDMPLLFEINYQDDLDYVLLVYTDYETQLNRLIHDRNLTKEEAVKRINSQLSLEIKKELTPYIVHSTSDDVNKLYKEVDEFIEEVKHESSR